MQTIFLTPTLYIPSSQWWMLFESMEDVISKLLPYHVVADYEIADDNVILAIKNIKVTGIGLMSCLLKNKFIFLYVSVGS